MSEEEKATLNKYGTLWWQSCFALAMLCLIPAGWLMAITPDSSPYLSGRLIVIAICLMGTALPGWAISMALMGRRRR